MSAIIENAIEIARSPAEVFDFLADQGNEPRWNPDCVSMEQLTPGPIGVGTQFRAQWKQGPAVVTRCTRFERPHLWRYENGGPIGVVLTVSLEPTASGGTRMTSHGVWTAHGWSRLVFPLFVLIMRRAERHVVENARTALEALRDRADSEQPGSVDGGSPGRLPIAVGLAGVLSVLSLATFAVAGPPFGAVNDVGNGLLGVLSGALAWTLRPRVSALALTAALLGSGVAIIGSWLVLSGLVGYFVAGLVSSVGFAGIGLWLMALNRSLGSVASLPPGLARMGVAAGLLMAAGFAMLPGIAMGLDEMATAPGWIWIGQLGWLGIYLLYPAWALWFGRFSGPTEVASAGSGA